MAYIPFDKMKSLREAAKNGDARARKIIIMQMNDEDFGSLLDQYFAKPETPNKAGETSKTEQMVNKEISPGTVEDNDIADPKLKKFLEYNDVKKGDVDYESTIEAYYQEFPKARPGVNLETKATNTDVVLPNDEDDGSSIYGDEDEEIKDDESKTIIPSAAQKHMKEEGLEASSEEKDTIDFLIEDEYEAIDGYDKAISKIMRIDLGDAVKKGVIADLEEIRRDEFEHVEKLKRIKASINKKEEKEEVIQPESIEGAM